MEATICCALLSCCQAADVSGTADIVLIPRMMNKKKWSRAEREANSDVRARHLPLLDTRWDWPCEATPTASYCHRH